MILALFELLAALVFGLGAARCLLREEDPLSVVVGTLGLALAGLLLAVDLLLPFVSYLELSLCLASVLLGFLSFWFSSLSPPPLRWRREPLAVWGILLLFLGATLAWGVYALADAQVIEGDFFIHAAQFGLFQGGWFPPQHPFYPGTPLHGHYGRPLMVAVTAALGGVPDLTAEWILTLLLQALTLLLFFTAFRRAGRSGWVGLGAVGFAFFAVNVGYRAGLMDTLQNHNAAAWFFVALSAWCILPVLDQDSQERPGMGAAVLAGLVLGTSQFVYETNFGLQWLALALLAGASRLAWEPARRLPLRPVLTILVVSALLACVEGGVVTSSLAGRLGLGQQVASERQAEGQQVSLHFPKERFLQVRLSNLTPAKPFETKFRPWKPKVEPTDDYAPLWDPRFFSGFWLTAWLAPIPCVFLWRRRQAAGLWFAGFGYLAVLVPATVDFGPVFEHETFRWLFASGLGLAVAWGATLPAWVAERRGRARVVALAVTLLVTWYCFLGAHKYLTGMQAAYRQPYQQHPTGLPAFMPNARYLPDPYGQLAWQFKMIPEDLEAAAWLRNHSRPRSVDWRGETFAANLEDWSANPKGALVGAARLPLGGHYHPLEDLELRPPMYSLSPQSTVFWASGRQDLLAALEVDWLFVRTDRLTERALRNLDGSLLKVFEAGNRRVYRVPDSLRGMGHFPAGSIPAGLQVEGRAPAALEPGAAGVGTLRITNPTAAPVEGSWWTTTFLRHRDRNLVVNPQDPIRQYVRVRLGPGQSVQEPWFLAAPYAGGAYLVEGPTTGPAPVLTVRPVSDEERFRLESAAPAGWR